MELNELNEMNLEIITVGECDFLYEKYKYIPVHKNGKIMRFEQETQSNNLHPIFAEIIKNWGF